MQGQDPINQFEVALITGRVVALSRVEATRIFVHPWILLTYSALSLLTVAMNQQPWTQGMPLWMRTAIYFLSSIVGLSTAWLTLMALSWAVSMRLLRRVHSIIFDLSGAFMSLFTTYGLVSINGPRPDLASMSSIFLYIYYIVIIVHVSIFLWSSIIPRILVQLRSLNMSASESSTAGNADEIQINRLDYTLENTLDLQSTRHLQDIVFGITRIPIESIVHVNAEGNYVRIYTNKSSYFEAVTMKAVLSQIPQNVGLRVHRSHWVSFSAIQSIVREGRGLKIILKSGAQVPVSRNNMEQVRKLM